ncbi:hypothetical protein [Rheinheimera sp.]|uniref:hypothetical protein n=1 Tax=Rheinheimera sp. TaxID=1869214 RepID=UPI003D2AB052
MTTFKSGLVVLLMWLYAGQTMAIDWYVRDWPPFNMQQGPDAGQGSYDLMLGQLVAALPQYQHRQFFATLIKRQQLMQQDVPHCLFGVLKSKERQEKMLFSDIAFYSPALRLVALADHPLWQANNTGAAIELSTLLQQPWTGMVEYKRLYPAHIQQFTGKLLQVSDSSTDLVAMLKAGRADYVVEYPDRIHWLASHHPTLSLRYARVAGEAPVVPVYVACQKSAQAAEHIAAINIALQQLRRSPAYQQAWLHQLRDLSRQELQAQIARDPLFQTPATRSSQAVAQ